MRYLLQKTSTAKSLLVLLSITIGLNIFIGFKNEALIAASNGFGILDLSFGYSVEQLQQTFNAYGPLGMRLFKQIWMVDMLNAPFYSLFVASLLFKLFHDSHYKLWVCIPFAVGALDLVENCLIHHLVYTFPDVLVSFVLFASCVTIAKHVGIVLMLVTFLVGVLRFLSYKSSSQVSH